MKKLVLKWSVSSEMLKETGIFSVVFFSSQAISPFKIMLPLFLFPSHFLFLSFVIAAYSSFPWSLVPHRCWLSFSLPHFPSHPPKLIIHSSLPSSLLQHFCKDSKEPNSLRGYHSDIRALEYTHRANTSQVSVQAASTPTSCPGQVLERRWEPELPGNH